MSDEKSIIWLDDRALHDVALVGGKGAGLLKMPTNFGHLIPKGFIVTTAVFSHIAQTEWWSKITEILQTIHSNHTYKKIEAKATKIQQQTLKIADTHPNWQTIIAAYRLLGEKLGQPNPSVAVRSSAQGEDSNKNSFAGLYTTTLSVQGEAALKESIKQCWASLFTPQAIAYRMKNGLAMIPKMATIVQQMIPARTSGVMMTLNPINGDRSKIVIEAIWGLGSPLVSSQINPDRFLIDKITAKIINQEIATKRTQQLPKLLSHQGTKIEPVSQEKRGRASLTAEDIVKLVIIGKELENQLGTAQDIEFAFQQENLFLLQIRPETVWSKNPAKSFRLAKEPVDQIISMMLGGGNNK